MYINYHHLILPFNFTFEVICIIISDFMSCGQNHVVKPQWHLIVELKWLTVSDLKRLPPGLSQIWCPWQRDKLKTYCLQPWLSSKWFPKWLTRLLPSVFVVTPVCFVCISVCVILIDLTRTGAITTSSFYICYVIHTSWKCQSFTGAPDPRYQQTLHIPGHLNIGHDSERGGKQTYHCGQTRGPSAVL